MNSQLWLDSTSGFPKAQVRKPAGLHPSQEALGKNPSSLRLLSEFTCFRLQDRGPSPCWLSVTGHSAQFCPHSLVAWPLLGPQSTRENLLQVQSLSLWSPDFSRLPPFSDLQTYKKTKKPKTKPERCHVINPEYLRVISKSADLEL